MLGFMQAIGQLVRTNGGALSYRTLDRLHVPRSAVTAAVAQGELVRVRNGWFSVPDAPADVVRAVRVGGALTGASVARLHGLWLMPDSMLHVRVRPTASRLRSPGDRTRRLDLKRDRVCVHYSGAHKLERPRDSLVVALAEMMTCSSVVNSVVALDSALNCGQLRGEDLASIRRLALPSRRGWLDLLDAGCESGLETIARLLLRGRNIRHRTQVYVRGVGRVDILIGDRLVLELDGEGFHTGQAFEEDRRRDAQLVAQGYLVVRVSYKQLIEFDTTRRLILALVRRGEHRWGARARRYLPPELQD